MPLIPAPPPARYTYLISRRGDLALSIIAGSLAFYFTGPSGYSETKNPEKSLLKLVQRRFKKISSVEINILVRQISSHVPIEGTFAPDPHPPSCHCRSGLTSLA
ncbi:6886_t:CDS:2 [Scutellospora calospora]|uniref:6886_t:CDS:1 n=1 Tax=Scutellospora calospora TaxID=85575 RepID=A0ACA9KN69_9GLOM|nr:6886_t:CDS:2 [Scutellospora calospora]